MAMYSGSVPSIGTHVVTADGDDLGKVKEVSGTCFKVDAPMQPDYWLATDCIGSATDMDVRLRFSKKDLGDAKMDGPDHTGVHPHRN